MKRGKKGAIWGVWLALLALPLRAHSQDVGYNGSFQFARGDYFFTHPTNSSYLLNGLDLTVGRMYVETSVPVIVQSTTWVAYSETPIPSGGDQSAEVGRQLGGRMQMGQGSGRGGRDPVVLPTDNLTYQSGVGDPIVRGNVEVFRTPARDLGVRLGGGVKFPLASPDDGFATGEWDYHGSLSLDGRASDRDMVFADLSYQVFGDMPGLPFRNALGYGLSWGRMLSPNRWSALVSLYGTTRILENSDAPVQVGLGMSRFFDNGRAMNFNVAIGLSETVPALSLGLGWRFPL